MYYRCVVILSQKVKVGQWLWLLNGQCELHFFPRPRLKPKHAITHNQKPTGDRGRARLWI